MSYPYNPAENPGLYYSVSGRLKKKRVVNERNEAEASEVVKAGPSSSCTNDKIVSKAHILNTPFRIGLDHMGVTLDQSTRLKFCSPACGPAKAMFWNNPADPNVDVTDKFCVVCVDSPNKFWVQNVNDTKAFRLLENDMTTWYNRYWQEGTPLDPKNVIEGGFYAAYLEDYQVWVRVRLMEFIYGPGPKECFVQLLDYGTQRLVQTDNLFFLRQLYIELPMQSAQMELYYEGDHLSFTAEDKARFNRNFGGKQINVIPLSVREEVDLVYPIIRGVLMSRRIVSHTELLDPTDFYSLNGRLKTNLLLQDIRDFQTKCKKVK